MLFVQPLHPVVLHCTINQSLYNKPNIGNRTPLSDGRKKEIYRDIRFFHGALQFPDFQDGYSPGGILETGFGFGKNHGKAGRSVCPENSGLTGPESRKIEQ